MLAVERARRVEVRRPGGGWVQVEPSRLEPGDVFRMFEPGGRLVSFEGRSSFRTTRHVMIHCEPVDD